MRTSAAGSAVPLSGCSNRQSPGRLVSTLTNETTAGLALAMAVLRATATLTAACESCRAATAPRGVAGAAWAHDSIADARTVGAVHVGQALAGGRATVPLVRWGVDAALRGTTRVGGAGIVVVANDRDCGARSDCVRETRPVAAVPGEDVGIALTVAWLANDGT